MLSICAARSCGAIGKFFQAKVHFFEVFAFQQILPSARFHVLWPMDAWFGWTGMSSVAG